ncbi:MAG: ankyrin repeat domain-containing protein, partial [Pseudomonadota bacterium]
NIIDFDFFADVAHDGLDEQRIWQFSWGGRPAFDPVWNMVLESSTGYSGSLGRQVTLNNLEPDQIQTSLMDALEKSAAEGAIVLIATGVDLTNGESRSFLFKDGQYEDTGNSRAMSRNQLVQHSLDGKMVVTLTGHHGVQDDISTPQPGLWTLGPMHAQRGRQLFPVIHHDDLSMSLMGRHLSDEVHLIIDGRRVEGSIEKHSNEHIKVTLANAPQEGLRFLQVQNRDGLFTNDFIFHVARDRDDAIALQNRLDPKRERAIRDAIQRGDVDTIARLFDEGAPVLSAFRSDGTMPLVLAAMSGEDAIVEYLISIGADVRTPNRDGNTALHLAAFMCHPTVVQRLLDHGAPIDARSRSGDTPADTVRDTWNQGLAGFYSNLINGGHFKQELTVIQKRRPQILKLLTQYERLHARRDSPTAPPLAMQ